MFEGMDGTDGFSLEDLADEEQAAQGQQGQTSTSAVAAAAAAQQNITPPDVQQQSMPQTQVPVYSQQWQQWDAQRRAGNIQPVPSAPMTVAAPQAFPWAKVLVGSAIAAAVVYGIVKLGKRGKKSNSASGSWHTIGD